MNNRERVRAILNYEDYDRMPVVHFGFWRETLEKWYREGHVTEEEWQNWEDGNEYDQSVQKRLGFDFNWGACFAPKTSLFPGFEAEVVGSRPDGSRLLRNADGVVVLQKDGAGSIPAEIEHTLKDRASWEEHYKWRLQFSPDRIDAKVYEDFLTKHQGDPIGLYCGSLFGRIRDIMGVEGVSYLYADDEDLYDEIIDTVGILVYQIVEAVLKQGMTFDFAHFWEDICFKNGPLVIPDVFYQKVGPYYKKITGLLREYGITTVSLDCDGLIDALIPTWLENGVNTMFPIEVGTWKASIAPWRERYGRELRGVGGMNKNVFSKDRAAVDQEIKRLGKLVELGGYIPCPDHRIAPDAEWDNVRYYCQQMRLHFENVR